MKLDKQTVEIRIDDPAMMVRLRKVTEAAAALEDTISELKEAVRDKIDDREDAQPAKRMTLCEAAKLAAARGCGIRNERFPDMVVIPTDTPECCILYDANSHRAAARWQPHRMDFLAEDWELTEMPDLSSLRSSTLERTNQWREKMERAHRRVQNGEATLNEIRRECGLAPIEGGDKLLIEKRDSTINEREVGQDIRQNEEAHRGD